jgi:SAM-dependent methyltransferase
VPAKPSRPGGIVDPPRATTVLGVYDRVRDSYDRVAQRYADEIGGELAAKPLDRALLRSLVEQVDGVAEASGTNRIGDLGCGPGHVAAYLAGLGATTVGIDLSPAMVEIGRERYPTVQFRVGTLLALPATDAELAGAVALYSILHLRPEHRAIAYQEMARVICPTGWLLVAFHVSRADAGHKPGDIMHAEQWWGEQVDLDFYYLDPDEVAKDLTAAGFTLMARLDREPWPGGEVASRRSYLLCRRGDA